MNTICRISSRISGVLQKIEVFIGSACLIALFTLMVVNAAARYLFDFPIIWSDEMNNFLFVWIGFLSCAYIMGNDGHIRITALTDALPPLARYILQTTTNIIMIVMFTIFIPYLFRLLGRVTFSGLLRIPLKFIYVIMPVSFILMCLHIVNNILQNTLRQFLSSQVRDMQATERKGQSWN